MLNLQMLMAYFIHAIAVMMIPSAVQPTNQPTNQTNQPTNQPASWSIVPEKLLVSQPLGFPTFYGLQSFSTLFTRSLYMS